MKIEKILELIKANVKENNVNEADVAMLIVKDKDQLKCMPVGHPMKMIALCEELKDQEYLEKLQQKIVGKLCEDFKSEMPAGVDPVEFKKKLIKDIIAEEFLETLERMTGEKLKDKVKINDLDSKEVN
nr:MAG TPA: hypothetical protein [Caudoviricetes sp.]